MDAPNIHIISADGQPVNMANMGANSMSQLDRNPGSASLFAPPLYPASYNFGNAPTAKEEVPPKLLNNNILRVQQRGILAHTHSMDELFSIKDILNGENIDANELPITDFGNPPVIAKDGETPADQESAQSFQGAAAKSSATASVDNVGGGNMVSIGKQETAGEDQRNGFNVQSKMTGNQTSAEHQASYGLETDDQEGSTYDDQYNKVVPKLRFKSPKRKSPSSSEEKLIEVEGEQNENDKPIVHVNKKRRFNSYQYLFSPDFDDNPNQYIDVLRTKYTLPNKSNTYFEDGGRFTEISLAIRKQRIAKELAQKDQMKQVRVKKTLKAK